MKQIKVDCCENCPYLEAPPGKRPKGGYKAPETTPGIKPPKGGTGESE